MQRLGEVNVAANEWAFAVLDGDERLLASLRDGQLLGGHRWQALSDDGGMTWSAPRKMTNLVEPFTGI